MQTILRAATSALFVLGSAGLAAATPTSDGWVADYDEAMRLAQESGKDVIVDFTGSDWCGWCIKLDEEVFSQEAFKAAAPEQYVLCALDFPNGEEAKAKVPNPERNEELMNEFGVRGFPTILVLTNEGQLLAQTGYREGGAEAYLEHLEEIRAEGRAVLARVDALIQAYETAEEGAKRAALVAIVDGYVDMAESAPSKGLVAYVEKAAALEGEGTEDLRIKALGALLENGGASDDMIAAAEALDPQNEHGLLEKCVMARMMTVASLEDLQPAIDRVDALLETGNIVDAATVAEMCANCAVWSMQYLDDPDGARRYAEKALELGLENERMVEGMQGLLDELGPAEEEEAPAPEPAPAPRG